MVTTIFTTPGYYPFHNPPFKSDCSSTWCAKIMTPSYIPTSGFGPCAHHSNPQPNLPGPVPRHLPCIPFHVLHLVHDPPVTTHHQGGWTQHREHATPEVAGSNPTWHNPAFPRVGLNSSAADYELHLTSTDCRQINGSESRSSLLLLLLSPPSVYSPILSAHQLSLLLLVVVVAGPLSLLGPPTQNHHQEK